MRKCQRTGAWSRKRHAVGLAALCLSLNLSHIAQGQAPASPSRTRGASSGAEQTTPLPKLDDAEDSEATAAIKPPMVAVQTGAPQPPSQNLASPLPATASASPALVRVGGGAILIYANNYDPKYDQQGNKKKNYFDAWRASIVLDSKLDRFGMHIEFRARDRGLRWMPTSAWLEECYASVELISPGGDTGPVTLKVGKSYEQFGRVWDNSFYGSIAFRDGLKLDPNWGLSLEGAVFATRPYGARYFAQYYILDGQTNTSATNRDTISQVAAGSTNTGIGARRRERFIGRIEPYYKFAPDILIRLGASIDRFTADYVDTQSPADMAAGTRVKSNDNTDSVLRAGADITAQYRWFSGWAEYAHQRGAHTNSFPVPPRADNPTTMESEARGGSPSNDVSYWMAGGNFVYTRYTIQYNYSSGLYKNVRALDAPGRPIGEHREWIHNPGVQVAINDQLKLIIETPIWKRKALAGLTPINPSVKGLTTQGQLEVVEKQVIVTLHGKF